MHEPSPFTEQQTQQLADEGYKFIAVDDKERKAYALKVPMTSGNLASLEWKQYQIESEEVKSLAQSNPSYELHVITNAQQVEP